MRNRIFLVIVAIGIIAALSQAQADPEKSAIAPNAAAAVETAAPVPRLVFEELVHDFGNLGQKQDTKHIFKFRNSGEVLLVIDNVKATCGCTGTLLSKNEIPPGGEGEIEVTFRTGMSSGKKKKRIDVYSNDPENPSIKLYITANIIVPVEVKPRSLYWLAEKDEPSKRKIEFLYQPDHETKIVKLESSSPALKATFRPKSDGEAAGYDIDIEFDGSLPVGDFRERLTIVTDNPKHPSLQVKINGRVTGAIRVVPNSINFGVIRDDLPPARDIRVYAKNQQDFKITAIESANPLISTELTRDDASNGYRVTVRLTDKPPRGGFSEKLLIKTNSQTEKPIVVLVYAFIR